MQKMQGAAAEYQSAGIRMGNSGSCRGCRVLLLNAATQSAMHSGKNPRSCIYELLTSNLKDLHFSHPTCTGLATFRGAIAGHKISHTHTHTHTHTHATLPRADPNFLTHFTAKDGPSIFEWSTLSM